jgi:hypothetical protein
VLFWTAATIVIAMALVAWGSWELSLEVQHSLEHEMETMPRVEE